MLTPLIKVVMPIYIADASLYPIVERCIQSFRDYYPDLEILGIDDASPLPIPDDWPIAMRHFKNQGYTKTVNSGLDLAFGEKKADVVIVANDDLVIHEGDLDNFYWMEEAMIGSPADTASSPDDRFGCIWGLTREAYEKLGPLDDRYKHFFSDLEYYKRAKEKGVTIEKWHDIIIEHVESATYKTVDKDTLFKEDEDIWNQ